MELLIGIACIGATVYYFYLMANFFDTKIAMKEIEEFVDRITNFDSLSEGKDQ